MITYSEIQSSARNISCDTLSLKDHLRDKRRYFIYKRILDITISALFIVLVFSWLFPIIAMLIKLSSKGPVLFIQKRVGLGGRSFDCFKFRTMVVNEDADTLQAKANDRRITRLGKLLRDSNMDEFPQFLNVLLGHMSIVGPRPHMHADCAKFSSVIPGYKFRNIVKPGITGLAQTKGYRGPTNDFSSMFHRYQFDAFYIRNAGFGLDMRIIRQTAAQTLNNLYYAVGLIFIGKKGFYRRWLAVFVAVILYGVL